MTGQVRAMEFSRTVRLEELGRNDLDRTLTASPSERDALARRFRITEISALEATLKIRRLSDGVFEAFGSLEADIVFMGEEADEAMDFTVNEAIEEVFVTPAGLESLRETSIDDEVDAELVTRDLIDLGEVVAQNLSLALDPVLLEIGTLEAGAVTYSAGVGSDDDPPEHPFAGLAVLRRPGNQNDDSSKA
jgi:hypothetical protein